MKILSFDSCNGLCSTALIENNQLKSFKIEEQPSLQAERLFTLIEATFAENNINYNDLTAIALNIGPGSFTGVRIGLAAAKGIRLAANLPLIGISGFMSLASCVRESHNYEIMVVLDARREQLYLQKFNADLTEIGQPILSSFADAIAMAPQDKFILIGDGAELIKDGLKAAAKDFILIDELKTANAAHVAEAAALNYASYDFSQEVEPLYIREADVKKPNKT